MKIHHKMPEHIRKLNTGLIGCGYWGSNILRDLIVNSITGKLVVCEKSPNILKEKNTGHFTFNIEQDTASVFADNEIDAIIIATPTATHYNLTKQALLQKKHVLVEKPFCMSSEQAQELIALAELHNLVLMVDHIFLYHPVVRQLKEYISTDFLGKINYIDATRINLGIYQKDTNVLWDLACHDISIINYLVGENPDKLRAIGRINSAHNIEDISYLFLYYPSGMLVQINSSWASPVKMRKMIIGGEKRMIIYDDIEPTNKLIIYDYGQKPIADESKSGLIDYRLGNITIPKCEIQEPLKNVIQEFYECIIQNRRPLSDGKNAIQVIEILEKAQESINNDGALILLN